MVSTRLTPEDLKNKRRRAGPSQAEVGAQFYPRPISKSAVGNFENGDALPFGYGPDDYLAALTRAIREREAA